MLKVRVMSSRINLQGAQILQVIQVLQVVRDKSKRVAMSSWFVFGSMYSN